MNEAVKSSFVLGAAAVSPASSLLAFRYMYSHNRRCKLRREIPACCFVRQTRLRNSTTEDCRERERLNNYCEAKSFSFFPGRSAYVYEIPIISTLRRTQLLERFAQFVARRESNVIYANVPFSILAFPAEIIQASGNANGKLKLFSKNTSRVQLGRPLIRPSERDNDDVYPRAAPLADPRSLRLKSMQMGRSTFPV